MTPEQRNNLRALYSKETTERIQPNFNDVKITANNIAEIIILADAIYSDNFQTNATNIEAIKTNASQIDKTITLANIKDILTSLVNDKPTLDSLYNDKPTLDGLYALKDKIDSLFADKIKLDSLYEDKTLLNAVNENKSNIDAVATIDTAIKNLNKMSDILLSVDENKLNIDAVATIDTAIKNLNNMSDTLLSVDENKSNINAVKENEANINAVNENKSNIDAVNENLIKIINSLTNANIATQKATEAKSYRDEAQEFKNQAQAIAGGNIVAENVKFSNNDNLEEFKQTLLNSLSNVDNTADENKEVSIPQQNALNLKINISDIVDNLTSTIINKPLSANQGKVLKDAIDNINTILASDDTTLDELQEIVNYIKQNKTSLESLDLSNIAETITLKHFTATLKTKLENLYDKSSLDIQLASKANKTDIKTINGFSILGGGNLEIVSIPKGLISMWSGTIATIPNGWFLCDGNNETPNLQDRFIYGTTVEEEIGQTGGSANAVVIAHSHTGSTNTTGNHSHSLPYQHLAIGGNYSTGSGDYMFVAGNSASSGNHSHTLSINSSGEDGINKNLPPYYKLAFIMKG